MPFVGKGYRRVFPTFPIAIKYFDIPSDIKLLRKRALEN